MVCCMDKHTGKWNRIECPEIIELQNMIKIASQVTEEKKRQLDRCLVRDKIGSIPHTIPRQATNG